MGAGSGAYGQVVATGPQMTLNPLDRVYDYLAKRAELRKLDCARATMPIPTPPALVDLGPSKAVWEIQVPGQACRFMSAASGSINDEFFIVNVGTELFYRTWLQSSPSVRVQRWEDCVLRSKMPHDYKYKHAIQGFSGGRENPVPLALCGAFMRGKRTHVGFTNGVTRTFWLIANQAVSFPVQVHGHESAELLNSIAGLDPVPTSFADLFARARADSSHDAAPPRAAGGDKIMISKQDQLERRIVLQSALASQRIEGLEPDTKAIEDAQKWARGEMSIADAIANYKARLRQEQTERAAIGRPIR